MKRVNRLGGFENLEPHAHASNPVNSSDAIGRRKVPRPAIAALDISLVPLLSEECLGRPAIGASL